jgi:PAS domain S-box-containing protein
MEREEAITRETPTEEALRRSEDRLRTVMDASADGFWDRDLVTGRVFHSARMNEMVGRPPVDEVVDTDSWRLRVHPDDLALLAPEYERVLRGHQERIDATYRVRCDDGTWKWVRARAKVVARDESGQPVRVAGVVTDVTTQKRTEEALNASESLFRVAFENSATGMVMMGLDGRPIRVNQTLCKMVGYSEQELLGLGWRRLTPPEDVEATVREFQRATETPQDGGRLEKRYVRKDGAVIWADVSTRVVLAGDKVQHFVTTVVDITGRKRAEEALRESEARFRTLANSAPVGIFQTDSAGKNIFLNAEGERITGVTAEQARDSGWTTHLHPADRERVFREWVAAAQAGRDFSSEYRFVVPGAGERWVRGYGSALEDRSGANAGYVGVVVDITEARAAQVQLQVASRLAALGTLVAGIAHEINNPLAGALAGEVLAAETLRDVRGRVLRGEGIESDDLVGELDEVLEGLADAETGIQRISRIVKDLVTFGRSDQRRTRIRLMDAVEQAMRWLPVSMSNTVDIRVEDRDAPEVKAALGQMTQVVVNLVGNAAKSMPEGRRGVVRVRVGPGEHGKARLEVEDDGTGMAPDVMARIFDPFFTTRKVGEGMGLGLAVTHAIVAEHGGTITVRSEVGKGSTFRVDLPAAPADA